MASYVDDEEKAERLSAEKRQLDDAWNDLVKSVLSHTRIDPKYKDRSMEFFEPYGGEITSAQVAALQRSNYGNAYQQFVRLWKNLPEGSRPELDRVTEVFSMLSVVTQSGYREVLRLQKGKAPFSEIEILKNAQFLTTIFWSDSSFDFDVLDLEEQLNEYISLGIELRFIERALLKLCIKRALDEERTKIKPTSERLFDAIAKKSLFAATLVMVVFELLRYLVPILFWLGLDAAIVIWSLDRISGDRFSIWAVLGLIYVGITMPISIIHYGMSEVRHSLKKIIQPGWDAHKPTMNADLTALGRTVNGYRNEHINLRVVRGQLVRLLNTEIGVPVQLITLLDRSIANGAHHW
jgi:hypothetical protein